MNDSAKCEFCAQDYIKENVQQKYCCPLCRSQATYARYRKPEALKIEKECKLCGKAFRPASDVLKYCSPECRHEAKMRQTQSVPCKCRGCGVEFTRNGVPGAKVYCSPECREKKYREANRVKHAPKKCAICSQSFIPVSSAARFCSDKCRMVNAEKFALRSDYYRRQNQSIYGMFGDE